MLTKKSFTTKLLIKFPRLYILLKTLETGFRISLLNIAGYKTIKNNGLFNEDFYLHKHDDLKHFGQDPLLHYILYGHDEGRNPNPNFNGKIYLENYKDIKKSNLNPLIHFALYGQKEKRNPGKLLEDKDEFENLDNFSNKNEKICNISEYKHLKLTLKGENGYLFLINDSNNEIGQHFDFSYENNFDIKSFIETLNFKKNFCKNRKIKYYFFITPDKSLVCKEFLPFDKKIIKRNYDLINDLVSDFTEKLNHECYFKIDSHMNYLGGLELSYCYLNYLDNKFDREDFNKLVKEQIITEESQFNIHFGDLLAEKNWSYPLEERKYYQDEKPVLFRNKFLVDILNTLPVEFRWVGNRETEYHLNPKGYTNLRVLILRDSTTNYLKDIISSYFGEILLYWDHWVFNKELVEWYKPDVILEIRTERFLEMKKKFN